MKKSPLPFLVLVVTLPMVLGAGCAFQSDLKMLQQEVKSQRSYIDKVNADSSLSAKRAQNTATSALKNAEQAANAATKAGEAAEAAIIRLARMLEKPKSIAYALEFGFNKARVNNLMGRQLDAIVNEWKGKAASFKLVGHADTVGSKKSNMMMALKRANEVKSALMQRGVPPSIVSAIGVGEEAPMVQTNDGQRLRANRVVVLTIVGQKI